MPTFVSIESPKLGSAVQLNNEENTTVVSVENSTFGSVVEVNKQETVNVYHLENTDIQSYYNEISRQHAEAAQTAQSGAELAESGAQTAETNAKASELDAEAAQVAAETAQANAEAAEAGSIAARNAAQTAQSLSETAQAGAELAETNAKASELDAEAAQFAAEAAQANAETAEAGSVAARNAAQTAQSLSETARNQSQAAQAGAELAETNAKLSELDAEAAQLAAEAARNQSQAAQAAAELAESGAQTAKANAELAQAGAETAQANAQIAESGSISARDDSVNAKLASEAARNTALAAQTGAEAAETAAQTHASDANAAKVAAQTAQANAETAQSAAETAEANAQASASSAATSAQSASDDAARAEAAANTAVNTLSAKGDWDASTGVYPTPTPNSADFYQISVAGTMTGAQGSMQANIGDQLYWNVDKAIWYKIDNTDHVISVNGKEGTIVLDHTDVGALGATENAVSASKWQTARTLTLNGDASGAVSIDGSSNVTLNVDVAKADTLTTARTLKVGATSKSFDGSANVDWSISEIGAMKGADFLEDANQFYPSGSRYNPNANNPTNEHYAGLTYGNDGNVTGQLFTHFQTGASYVRAYNTSWSAWQRLFADNYHPNADKWTTARTISLSGDASGSVAIDGSGNVTLPVTVANDSHNHTSLDGITKLRFGPGVSANDDAAIEWLGASNAGYLRFSTSDDNGTEYMQFGDYDNTAQGGVFTQWLKMYRGQAQFTGNVSASTFTGALSGNASTASKWATARSLSLSGDASGSVSFDGSANATLAVTVADNSHSHTTQEVGYSRWRVYDMPFSTTDSYRERVILLFPVSVANTTERNMVNGRIMLYKTGGNVYDSFDVWGQSCYNNTSISMCSHGQRAGHKLVTFNYGGVKWLGIKISYTANPHHSAQFFGFARTRSSSLDGNQLRIQDYIDRESGTVVTNSEINDSIADWNGGNGNLAVEHAGALRVRNGIVSSKNITLADNSKMTLGDGRGWITGSGPVVSMESIGNITIKADNDNASPTEYLTLAAGLNSLTVQGGARNDASGLKFNGNIVLDTNNYSTHLDGRYYTESESNSRFVQNSEVASTATWAGITNKYLSKVTSSGVLEVARYIDFHTNNSTADYDVRLDCNSSGSLSVVGGTLNGSFVGSLSGNASSASKWATARNFTIGNTGKSVNGSANVSWSLSEIGALPLTGGTLSGATVFNSHTLFNQNVAWSGWETKAPSSTGQIRLSSGNNGANISLDSGTNTRKLLIQVGHNSDAYPASSVQGILHLNPQGGTVYANGSRVYNSAYHPSADTATTATYLNSDLITGSGQDLKIRDKRALVGTTSNLIINYGNDYTHALVQSQLRASGEIISSSANGWRIAYGNYGFFVRNDGSNTYFMMTNSGDSYGSYNSLRPLYISNSSGRVTMGNGLSVSGGVTTAPVTSSNSANSYSIASQGAGVYAVLWSQTGYSNYSTILIWDGSKATLNGDYGNGLVPAISTSGTIYSAASTNWIPKRVVKIG
ncbi:hypothetical protein [Vibrio parahaemolyticus]|uniref:phage tail fiber protein n=1 Tax=Vibrio parahaemolyticus TaxID=670 RepID=UPI000D38F193|nr:hypothetical protein [Vibrio parahaemolyticus]